VAPTRIVPVPPETTEPAVGRTAMMPLRGTTRSAGRAHRIATERNRNRRSRLGAPF
jgi:hypothetical protein